MTRDVPVTEGGGEESKSERVYQHLRRRIRELELPPGTRLRKEAIALECGVSRAPVSEAIARLAEEGLIDVFPQSGSFVAEIRRQDLRESFLIRTGLEVEAARRVTLLADVELLQRLDRNLKQQEKAMRDNDMARLDQLDESFHATIFSALESPRAQRMLDTTRAILDRSRYHSLQESGRPAATIVEHRRIYDAICTGDPELAGAAMRVHINMVTQAIENDMAQFEADTRTRTGR